MPDERIPSNAALQAAAIAAAVEAALQLERGKSRLDALDHRMSEMEAAQDAAQNRQDRIDKSIDHWQWGLVILAALGAVISWLLSAGSTIKSMFK